MMPALLVALTVLSLLPVPTGACVELGCVHVVDRGRDGVPEGATAAFATPMETSAAGLFVNATETHAFLLAGAPEGVEPFVFLILTADRTGEGPLVVCAEAHEVNEETGEDVVLAGACPPPVALP